MTSDHLRPLAWLVVGLAGCYSPNDPLTAEGGKEPGGDVGEDASDTADTDGGSSASGGSDGSDPTVSDPTSSTTATQSTTADTNGDADTSDTEEVDTTPPTVLALLPETGALGVTEDAAVVIRFSEPMDRPATQAAWQSPNIGGVVMSWNDDDTELTIVPNAPLEYATGDDVDAVEPMEFGFTIDTTATDKAGNALEDPRSSNFFTLRRIVVSPALIEELSGMAYQPGSGIGASDVYVGDVDADTQQKGLLSFTLPELPTNVDSIVGASVWADQTFVYGSPYGPLPALGEMHILRVAFDEEHDAYDTPALDDLGVFADDATLETKTFDVASAVADDYASASPMSQYRLEFPVATNGNGAGDRSTLERESLGMEIIYLVE